MFRQTNDQYEVRFRLADGKQWRADEARALLGSLLNGPGPVPVQALFHHSACGENTKGVPLLRFKGGHGFFAIVAIGAQAVQFLRETETSVRRCLSENLARPIRTEALTTDVSIKAGDRMRFYRAYLPVFARKHRHLARFFDVSLPDLEETARESMLRDLRRQSLALDLEMPSESFPFDILEMGRRGRKPLNKPGQRLYCGYLTYVDFATTLVLNGHWAVGGLQNRGYGAIRPLRGLRRKSTAESRTVGARYAQL